MTQANPARCRADPTRLVRDAFPFHERGATLYAL